MKGGASAGAPSLAQRRMGERPRVVRETSAPHCEAGLLLQREAVAQTRGRAAFRARQHVMRRLRERIERGAGRIPIGSTRTGAHFHQCYSTADRPPIGRLCAIASRQRGSGAGATPAPASAGTHGIARRRDSTLTGAHSGAHWARTPRFAGKTPGSRRSRKPFHVLGRDEGSNPSPSAKEGSERPPCGLALDARWRGAGRELMLPVR